MHHTFASVSLNQWALDFQGNYERTIKSFEIAKRNGACYRLGPELELCGYGCNDHFLEPDTIYHCWQSLAKILIHPACQDVIGDVGMPVLYNGIRYNCRIIFHDRKILLIRPKKYLANDGNYRELRWFTPWKKQKVVQEFRLPDEISKIIGQKTTYIGDAIIQNSVTSIGTELCEELFTPDSPHIDMSLTGVEIFTNGSASHHEFRKLQQRIRLICQATEKCGGLYLYANQQGCDGERVYYDGSALIVLNGKVLAQGSQFSLNDVEVITATVDLEEVRSYRCGLVSRNFQGASRLEYPKVSDEMPFCDSNDRLSNPIDARVYSPSQEIRLGPACWLWDYLRRSKSGGFFLPLSGGIDSCATALIVYSMCELVYEAFKNNDAQVISDLQNIVEDKEFVPKNPREISQRLFHTCYMGSQNSSNETKSRAQVLADRIQSYHLNISIDSVISSILSLFQTVTGRSPVYKVEGGSDRENLALQNIQLLLWTRGRNGALLVLGSSNVDETLRGYLTKYDCSSADINPIGGVSKEDLKGFIEHMKSEEGFSFLDSFLTAEPTAELEPITSTYVQTDEVDMGMTYAELCKFGILRKISKLGPFFMFKRLVNDWIGFLNPLQVIRFKKQIAEKVKKFFYYYSINRHKTTVLPPSYHMSAYSPDDNRFDLRPILYNARWNWQFAEIDKRAKEMSE